MNGLVEIRGNAEVTPQLLATLFWNMDSDQQAQFFASLERIAGVKLCLQMAYVLQSIADLSDKGDRDAQNGFQTMLSHAQEYVQGATEYRHMKARMAIRQ